jgi:predicted AAA+ superfamily ATPase
MDILGNILNRPLIKRDILSEIIRWIPKKEAIILVGSRQTGKTCLLYLLIQHLAEEMKVSQKNIFYLDLERFFVTTQIYSRCVMKEKWRKGRIGENSKIQTLFLIIQHLSIF